MEKLVDYFVSTYQSDNYQVLPAEIVTQLGIIHRATRGELKARLFNEAKRMEQSSTNLDIIMWLENCFEAIEKHSFRYHQVLFSPGKDIPETLTFLLDRAVHTIDICVFTISDQRLSERLIAAHNRGVKVRIITDDMKVNDSGSQVRALKKAGVNIKTDDSRYHMHHKFGLIDGRISFSGSYNWTYTATKHNQENLIVTTNYTIVNEFIDEYERLWNEMIVFKG